MTDNNNNVTMTAETPVAPAPVAPDPAIPAPVAPIPEAPAPVAPEAEAPAEQKEPKTGTITITVTEAEGGHSVGTNIDGSFNGMAFIAGLAGALSAISESLGVPGFVILGKLAEVYSNCAADEKEQADEDTEV